MKVLLLRHKTTYFKSIRRLQKLIWICSYFNFNATMNFQTRLLKTVVLRQIMQQIATMTLSYELLPTISIPHSLRQVSTGVSLVNGWSQPDNAIYEITSQSSTLLLDWQKPSVRFVNWVAAAVLVNDIEIYYLYNILNIMAWYFKMLLF